MIMQTLQIERPVNKGYGLSHDGEGKVVLVSGALPGEKIDVHITEKKKSYSMAKIKRVITQNKDRITPPCPYVKVCGGCNLQHATAELQCVMKTEIVQNVLSRSGSLVNEAAAHVQPCLASPTQFHYRQRIRLHIDSYQRPGFKKKKSDEIVAIDKCLLARPEINECLQHLNTDETAGELCRISSQLEILFNPTSGKTVLIYKLTRKPRPRDINYAKEICASYEIIERIFFIGEDFPLSNPISNSTTADNYLHHTYQATFAKDPITVRWEVGGFYQVNIEQNIQMIKTAVAFANIQQEETVLDLFCGMGNFSIPLAFLAKSVTGFEGQGSAIRSAKANAETNNLTNCSFFKKPVHKACEELIAKGEKYDCIIVDPPRQGAPNLASSLATLTDNKIIYISCDPATLGRDLSQLVGLGFVVETIQPMEMFPQTHHIETIVLLKKSNA